jgi:Protein of unknown function (DUF3987)
MNEAELKRTQLDQLEIFKELLRGKRLSRQHSGFGAVLDWLRNFPRSLKMSDKELIRGMVCESFGLTQEQLDAEITQTKVHNNVNGEADEVKQAQALEQELLNILPTSGMVRDYVDYTNRSEAPLAYHVFSALCAMGAVLNRRVWFNMEYYRVFPTLGIIILGPSGIKKTSAANIAVSILQELGFVKVYSEKLTPEAMIEAMKGDNAVGLVYAPEMSVFLSKAQYNEGLVQLITRFMDCPDVWSSETISRKTSVIHNIAISSLMCSTLDWFVGATPADSFGGGFIARNLLVVQTASARCEPIPHIGDSRVRQRIGEHLAALHALEGEVTFSPEGYDAYIEWYHTEHQTAIKNPDHELLATYYNRKPDHLKRIAIILHMTQHCNFELCDVCFNTAVKLLKWTEQFLPAMLQKMFRSQTGESTDQVLRIIHNDQPIPHSQLVRKMAYKMNAAELKTVLQSLKEARLIIEHVDNVKHYYTLMEDK